jgi:hypothetical protein
MRKIELALPSRNKIVVPLGAGARSSSSFPKGHKEREIPLGRGVLEKLDAYADNYPAVPVTLPWGELGESRTGATGNPSTC